MRAVALLVPLLLLLPAAGADHCPGREHWPQTVAASPTGHYLAVDHCRDMCVFSIWVYEETNGEPGLQRADGSRDDTCGGTRGAPDTVVL